ncbi:hypothetical protein C1645_829240 [Glomus cerebriforme]|uniref:DNA-directed DNA polymerase n=1 Tax=Glomus cerebriforme TaxID=658196 RepID=A0A397SLE2_9GLOM|nr:hypothetical protein C1645_829240 [Glomus cerebriforme]
MIQSDFFEDAPALLFHPEAEKDKMEAQVIRYSGENYLNGILTRDDIVAENDGGLTAILDNALSNYQEIPFMAVDFGGSSEKIGEKNCYVLHLYGSLINGQKAVVTLIGIWVFFDIRVLEKESVDDFKIKIDKILCSTINAYKIEPIEAFPFHGYHTEKKLYLRVFTHGTEDRKKALQAIQDNDFETASDDISSFHRKIARENGIAISDWSMMSKYCCKKYPQYTYDFHVSVNHFRAVEDLKMISDRFPFPALIRDPQFNDSDYDWPFIVERASRLNLFEWMWKQITGDFKSSEEIQKWNYYGKIGVNSKNTFQKKKGVTDNEEEEEFRVQLIKVKICPEEDFISTFLKIPGCVPIDVRVCFKKLYPHAEVDRKSSLAFYLKKCELDGKADMPYNKIWRIYSEAKAGTSLRESHSSAMQNMHEVAYYSYVSLFDSHYRANGMKVRNLLGAYATKLDMLFSTRQSKNIEKGKYPGAYVFPPKKGIEIKRPVTGLDFASLYLSLIMSYNLSPEKIILTYEEVDNAQKNGNILHKIEFPFNDRFIHAWCVRHDNQFEKKGLYLVVLEDLFNKRVQAIPKNFSKYSEH